eukprot:SAG11_NODE_16626_length_542_cov_0.925508_2_plen_76_part_01
MPVEDWIHVHAMHGAPDTTIELMLAQAAQHSAADDVSGAMKERAPPWKHTPGSVAQAPLLARSVDKADFSDAAATT